MSAAVDLSECTTPPFRSWKGNAMHDCKCSPPCAECGHGKHMAIHGPKWGQPPGGEPWGHEYRPTKQADA